METIYAMCYLMHTMNIKWKIVFHWNIKNLIDKPFKPEKRSKAILKFVDALMLINFWIVSYNLLQRKPKHTVSVDTVWKRIAWKKKQMSRRNLLLFSAYNLKWDAFSSSNGRFSPFPFMSHWKTSFVSRESPAGYHQRLLMFLLWMRFRCEHLFLF